MRTSNDAGRNGPETRSRTGGQGEHEVSAATPRTIANAPDLRQLLAVVGALALAIALVAAVSLSRQVSLSGATSAAPAPVAHDHGWSDASGAQELIVSSANGGIRYMGIPYPTGDRGFTVVRKVGGIKFVGIPYPAPGGISQGGSNGTRFAQ